MIHGENDRQSDVGEPADLDRLLAKAVWPEPEPETLQWLESFWRGIRSGNGTEATARADLGVTVVDRRKVGHNGRAGSRLGRRRGIVAAAAVAVGLASVLLVWRSWTPVANNNDNQGAQPVEVTEPSGNGPALAADDAREPSDQAAVATAVVGRPATAFETFVFLWGIAQQQATPATPVDPLVQVLAQRVAQPYGDLDALCRPLAANRRAHERALAARIAQTRGKELMAAIDVLGRVGSEQSVPLLNHLSHFPETRPVAIRALGRLADPRYVGRLIEKEPEPETQAALLASLLARRDSGSLVVYLKLVASPKTGAAACEALAREPYPPIDELFAYFNSPRLDERAAAAVALGRLDNPAVIDRLARLVAHDRHGREALMALAASRHESAARFLANLRRDPAMAGLVAAARHHVESEFAPPPARPPRPIEDNSGVRSEAAFLLAWAWWNYGTFSITWMCASC
ncbi:MAG: HEAT repeat domain-containing protein [Pirellulales bacterium]|nr:HEAT repeat domain-containing protein [Pirellulales bacterium]